MERKESNSNTHSELHHWYRLHVLRCGLPSRITYLWAAIVLIVGLFDVAAAGGILSIGLVFFFFYFILSIFFNVDLWLFKKELEYDVPEYYGPGKELKKL
ncbi:MAG: hypothetical protein K9K37_07900 [Desulfocapsa sp.]|nr:hypothetical protein [Desulfocapsa sp.]